LPLPSSPLVTVRATKPSDRDAVLDVVRAAFSYGGTRDPQEELDIVIGTWALDAAPEGLDLVAVDDDTVVGYVVAAQGRLSGIGVLGVAPLAVSPLRQRKGIGTALMVDLIQRADADGWPLLLLVGDPAYYQRFGFEPASALGIVYGALGEADPHFQARRLSHYDPALRGVYSYCWEIA
jgi:putative acetyltransferase